MIILLKFFYHSVAWTMIFGTFSYIFYPFKSLKRIFKTVFSLPINWESFFVKRVYWASCLSLYIVYQNIGVPYDVLMLKPSTSYFYLICVSKSRSDDALNSQSYQTENSEFPIFYLTAGPGYEIWINGTARFTNAFLHISQPVTILMISKVWIADTTLVVVLNAAIILPAFSLASIHLH